MSWPFAPTPNEHQKIENIVKQIELTPINIRKLKDNFMNLRKGLELLLEKIITNKVLTKTADKASITVAMIPRNYWKCGIGISQTQNFIIIQVIETHQLLLKT